MTPQLVDLCLRALFAYLLGSISGSLTIGRLRGVDIRTQGSGNAGGTNALRTQGLRFAALVVFIDIGKGVLAVLLLPSLSLGLSSAQQLAYRPEWSSAVCAIAAVIGHIWPLYFSFRGGKGAATAIGAMGALTPLILPVVAVIWVATIILTGYVGLATMLAALSLWPTLRWLSAETVPLAYLTASVVITALVIYAHRSNIQRLWQGNENRFQRARLLHRLLHHWFQGRSADH